MILGHGARVNIHDKDFWTPLHVATACGSRDIVELLVNVRNIKDTGTRMFLLRLAGRNQSLDHNHLLPFKMIYTNHYTDFLRFF